MLLPFADEIVGLFEWIVGGVIDVLNAAVDMVNTVLPEEYELGEIPKPTLRGGGSTSEPDSRSQLKGRPEQSERGRTEVTQNITVHGDMHSETAGEKAREAVEQALSNERNSETPTGG